MHSLLNMGFSSARGAPSLGKSSNSNETYANMVWEQFPTKTTSERKTMQWNITTPVYRINDHVFGTSWLTIAIVLQTFV